MIDLNFSKANQRLMKDACTKDGLPKDILLSSKENVPVSQKMYSLKVFKKTLRMPKDHPCVFLFQEVVVVQIKRISEFHSLL